MVRFFDIEALGESWKSFSQKRHKFPFLMEEDQDTSSVSSDSETWLLSYQFREFFSLGDSKRRDVVPATRGREASTS